MKGKLYRRIEDGCIYEVIGQVESPAAPSRWILWNDRVGERKIVVDFQLMRQVGWELVGTVEMSAPQETTSREIPTALMK